jgi:hypothetical protein
MEIRMNSGCAIRDERKDFEVRSTLIGGVFAVISQRWIYSYQRTESSSIDDRRERNRSLIDKYNGTKEK